MISNMPDRPATEFEILVSQVNHYKQDLVRLGLALHEAKNSYPDMVGEGVNTWRDFLEQPEIGLTVREANSFIELSKWLMGVKIPLEDLNLATAKFGASKGVTDPDLLEDMKVLSLRDFKERHYDSEKREDNAPRTYQYMVMKRCEQTGNMQKVYGDELVEVLREINNGVI